MPPYPADDSCVAFLVRHGATENNDANPQLLQGCGVNPGLSPTGEHQAECVGRLLADARLAAVYSSPLLRAVQTAERIAQPHGLVVRQVEALHEVDVGRWESRSWLEIERTEPEAHRRFLADGATFGYPGGENMVQLLNRIGGVMEQLLQAHLGQRIAVVGHNVTHRVFVAHVLGIPLKDARRVTHDNGGVSVVDYRQGKPRLTTLNANFHLTS